LTDVAKHTATSQQFSNNKTHMEPLDIIAKTVHVMNENVKTGAGFSFLNLERFIYNRNLLEESFS
jgi:hypothetical protein